MIVIAVVASLVAYAWVTGLIGGTTSDSGNAIQIQSTTYTSGAYTWLVVYVQNVGQGTVNLKQDGSVYVNDVLHQITHSPRGTQVNPGDLIPIPVGQTVEIVTDYVLAPGEHVKIKIVTVEGTFMEFNGKPSGDTNTVPENRFSLTVNVLGNGGSVSKNPNQPSYAAGQVVQLVISANKGWQFSQWGGDLSGAETTKSITMDGNKVVTATFTQKEYTLTVTYQGTGHGAVSKSSPGPYHLGDTVQLTANPTGTDLFVGWSGDASGTSPTTSITIDETPEVTATFAAPQATQYLLTVTSNPANGGLVDINPAGPLYSSGQIINLTPNAATGYTFTGWTGDLSGSTNPAQISMTKNTVITANFALSTVTLSLSSNPQYAGSISVNPSGTYHYGDVVQLTAVANTPFDFLNWGQDLAGSTNPVSITLNGNKAVTANFVAKEYTLDLQQLGQGTIEKTPDKATYHLGDLVTLKATEANGWSFAGWTGDKTSSERQIILTIDENPAVLATFTQQLYSLTVRSNPEAGGPVQLNNTGPEYYYNDVVELTPKPVLGYHFLNWDGDITGTTIPATVTVTRNMIVTANFAPDPVTLTVNISPLDSGIVNQVPTIPYLFGDQVELTAVPKPGYTFSSWSDALTGSTNPSQITLYGDKIVTANFVAIEYPLAITISPALGGSVTQNPLKSTYHLNEQVILTAQPAPGYSFVGWSQDASGTNPTYSLSIDGTPQVTAVFSQIPYTLTTTANPSNGGSITRNNTGPTYTLGDKVLLTAVPAVGHRFTGWSEGLTGTTNPAVITITGNMVVEANFEPIDISLFLNYVPSGKGTATANFTGPYHYGDVVQLTAVAIDAAYTFDYWSGSYGAVNPLTLTLTADTTITVNFKLKPTQDLLNASFDNPTYWDLGWRNWGNPPWGRATDQVLSGIASAKCIGGTTVLVNHESFESTWPPTSWSSTGNWARENDQAHAGSWSADFDGSGTGVSGDLTTQTFDCSDADFVTIDFWLYNQGSSSSEIRLQIYDGANWDNYRNLGGANGWTHYQITVDESQYLDSTFRVRWNANGIDGGEYVNVDDVYISKEISKGQYQTGPFTSDSMNAVGAKRIIVSFDYRLSQTLSADNFQIYYSGSPGSYYDASRMTTLANLGDSAANTWIHVEQVITDPTAFTSSFRFGFLSQNVPNNAAIWVDNIAISMQIA